MYLDKFKINLCSNIGNLLYYNLNNIGSIYNAIIPPGYHHNCRCGLGIMYKAINVQYLLNLIEDKDMKTGYCFIIWDKYNNSYTKAYMGKKENTAEININIEDFTSFIMGCIPAEQLYNWGLIKCDRNILVALDADARFKQPICISIF